MKQYNRAEPLMGGPVGERMSTLIVGEEEGGLLCGAFSTIFFSAGGNDP